MFDFFERTMLVDKMYRAEMVARANPEHRLRPWRGNSPRPWLRFPLQVPALFRPDPNRPQPTSRSTRLSAEG